MIGRRGFLRSMLGATLLPWARVSEPPVAAVPDVEAVITKILQDHPAIYHHALTDIYISPEALSDIRNWDHHVES